MSACFLWISHPRGFEPTQDEALYEALSTWVPFEVERAQRVAHPSGRASAFVWETHAEGARGGYVAQSDDLLTSLSFTGWWREPEGAPLSLTSAEVALQACMGWRAHAQGAQGYERGLADFSPVGGWGEGSTNEAQGVTGSDGGGESLEEALDALHLTPGQFAFGLSDPTGRVHGVNSVFCGVPLCYAEGSIEVCGERAQVTLISNRASLISVALEGGEPASPRSEALAWLLSRSEHPVGESELAYPGVHRVHAGQRVSAFEGRCSLSDIELPLAQRLSDEVLFESFLWRIKALERHPDLPLSIALTGGFDSRLVFSGLLATGQLERVKRFYINAHPDHPDTRSAQAITAHYGLELSVDPPGRGQDPSEPLLDRLRRHNHLTEYLCSAWDIVSGPPNHQLPTYSLLPGHMGELYRGHALPVLSRAWWLLLPVYKTFMNRHKLLTDEMASRCASLGLAWHERERQAGVPVELARDRLHRHARMNGWISQCHPIEGLGLPSFALLSCVSTRAHYEAQTLAERERPSVHYALMRRVDEELWRLPLANKGWPEALYRGEAMSPAPPLTGGGQELGYQMKLWGEQGAELGAWLLDTPASSELWRVISRERLQAKLKRVERSPHPQDIKSLMCACGIKLALSEPLRPVKLKRAQ